jgi:glycosyltransferase involved in cell wall biosynthesis
MTKVLYISHIFQSSGWGDAARNYCLALDSVGIDVVCRAIKLNGDNYQPDEKFQSFLSKDSHDCDYVVQHVLPSFLSFNSSFQKNVSLFVAESKGWNFSGWHHYINHCADELFIPNSEMAEDCTSFIKVPIKIVPHATDVNKFTKSYAPLDLPLVGYNFYFIGELTRRKRVSALIAAFNMEFKKSEPVNLILKLSKPGQTPDQLGHETQELCRQIKSGLKIYRDLMSYPTELIIASRLSDEDMMRLHEFGDCCVSASYGEAWGLTSAEAMFYGNSVICPNCGGPKDYLKDYSRGQLISGKWESCIGTNNETFENYNTAKEMWYNANIYELRKAMRLAYESGKIKDRASGLKQAEKYSHKNVGKIMKKALES